RRPSRELQLLVPHLDRRTFAGTGRLQRALELLLRRRRPEHPVTALRSQEPPRTSLRLGLVDQKIGELVWAIVGDRLRDEREEALTKLVEPLAAYARDAKHGDH